MTDSTPEAEAIAIKELDYLEPNRKTVPGGEESKKWSNQYSGGKGKHHRGKGKGRGGKIMRKRGNKKKGRGNEMAKLTGR